MGPAGNSVKNIIREFQQKLAGDYPAKEVRQFIYILFDDYLGWPNTRVQLSLDEELPEQVLNLFQIALGELGEGKPIQYILKKTWFNGSRLMVDANVLVPRPETEELCSIIKAEYPQLQDQQFAVLDIGTGSGCIAIDLKKHFPDSTVTAVDNSFGALEIAGRNARSNDCAITFIAADILKNEDWADPGKYNMIVSNPPYVLESEKIQMHRNVTDFEPSRALFVDDLDPLLYYRAIAGFAAGHLISPALLYVEINERFGKEVGELLQSFGFDEIRILQDFRGKDRFVAAVLRLPPSEY